MAYVRGINPVWLFADLRGHLFDDTFYMFVLENTIPYIPATVYHASNGTPWTNPIRFFANGTLPVDIFFDPGTAENPIFYRLEFRQGPMQADPLIYLIENYSPVGFAGSSPLTSVASFTGNQVSNPQFALVNFQSPLSITAAGTYEIAPGWFLDLTGAGTATLEQTPLNSSSGTKNPTNAPYALHIVLTGWGAASLRQRFQQNGMLWASTASVSKYVASSITAKINGIAQNINADLVDSMGQVLGPVLNSTVVSTNWTEYPDHLLMPVTTNTNVPPNAYIDYRLHFETPGNADLFVTSFQLVSSNVALNFSYIQDSVDRQLDHTFHLYREPLIEKAVNNYAVGWDFPLNPCQQSGFNVAASGVAIANKSFYIADQTICFQSVANTMTFTISNPEGLTVITGSDTSFALIQYLDQIIARELLAGRMSVRLKGYIINGAQTSINGNVRLFWTADATLPDLKGPNYNSLVSAVASDGTVTIGNGTWTEVPRPNQIAANFTLPLGTGEVFNTQGMEFEFNGWDATATSTPITTAAYFAIVVGFETLVSTSNVRLKYITLNTGDVGSPPAHFNRPQTLQALQSYYRSSFNAGTIPANNVGLNTGETYGVITKTGVNCPGPFIRFDQYMRGIPNITIFNPSGGASGQIYNITKAQSFSASDAGTPTSGGYSVNGFTCKGTTDAGATVGDQCSVHWLADARLGIVL